VPPPLPSRVHLPSGLVVTLDDKAAARALASDAAQEARPGSLKQALAFLNAAEIRASADKTPVDVSGLSLRDAHTLRALFTHAGLLPEEPAELRCENCDKPFRIAPSSLLETGPFVDGELSDPELDAPFNHDKPHPIPPIRVGTSLARSVRIAARSLEEASPLWLAEEQGSFRFTPALVVAMGITALGKERRASVIADALSTASAEAYQAVADLLYEAFYPARLVAVYRCASCGARNHLDVPWLREIPSSASEPRERRRAFPDLDTFEAMVRSSADRIFALRGVRNIDLVVHEDVPFCDDSGEPLLGCYTPGGTDEDLGIPRAPEIRLFYRTFAVEFRHDKSFNVEAEIDETIDHEITHHLHQLAGDDPLDDEEREQIASDEVRRIGRREAMRREKRKLFEDVSGFFRTTWPLFVIAFVATYLTFCR